MHYEIQSERNPSMLDELLPAAIASLITLSSALALPTTAPVPSVTQLVVTGFVLIEDRNSMRRGDTVRRDNDRQQFTPRRRYRSAPPGWNRHGNRRPGDWRRRCIMVGPIWFCP